MFLFAKIEKNKNIKTKAPERDAFAFCLYED